MFFKGRDDNYLILQSRKMQSESLNQGYADLTEPSGSPMHFSPLPYKMDHLNIHWNCK